MGIISYMDIQHMIFSLPSESNVMPTKVRHLLIIMLITVPLAPTAGVLFTPNTILFHVLSLFKTVALIILNKDENR